jgi:hypothetical protein
VVDIDIIDINFPAAIACRLIGTCKMEHDPTGAADDQLRDADVRQHERLGRGIDGCWRCPDAAAAFYLFQSIQSQMASPMMSFLSASGIQSIS